ncbi:MAG: hypothetical protein H6Q73_3384 [Firmicutes bacterium]|nr:hypothetical protein [Bacillota bacterium]
MEAIKFFVDYDDEVTLEKKLADYIEEHVSYDLPAITIGHWNDAYDTSPEPVINYLIANKAKFPNLKKIFLGDIDSDECEVSWIIHTDAAPLINEFALEEIIIKGANGLRLKNAASNTLKELTIISGGLASNTLNDIAEATIPNLEHLELYLGVDDYGFDGDISTLEPFMQRSNFPKVTYWGLKNSEIADEICERVLASDILPGLEVLDISLGTLSNRGAELILENMDKLAHLKTLDLTYNYVSDELLEKIIAKGSELNIEVLCSKEDVYNEDDEDYRYPYITE